VSPFTAAWTVTFKAKFMFYVGKNLTTIRWRQTLRNTVHVVPMKQGNSKCRQIRLSTIKTQLLGGLQGKDSTWPAEYAFRLRNLTSSIAHREPGWLEPQRGAVDLRTIGSHAITGRCQTQEGEGEANSTKTPQQNSEYSQR